MELYILRHGKAEPDDSDGDATRPLTRKGTAEIREITGWMVRNTITFDLIATSPLKRAYETAEIVAEGYGQVPVQWEELAPGLDFNSLMKRIRTRSWSERILIVGHEPSLSDCIGRIITETGNIRIQLKKGGLARIGNFSPEGPVTGELSWLLAPRHMLTR